MLRRVVLAGGGDVTTLKVLLSSLTADVQQAYHEFMSGIIESIRYRDRAMSSAIMMLKSLDENLARQYYLHRTQMVALVKHLVMDLMYQLEDFNLYDKEGVLMYTYYRHPDPTFPDVVLTCIIPLTWNGILYESNLP